MQTEKAYHDKIIKNVSTRRSLNLDLWATHKFSLFFKSCFGLGGVQQFHFPENNTGRVSQDLTKPGDT